MTETVRMRACVAERNKRMTSNERLRHLQAFNCETLPGQDDSTTVTLCCLEPWESACGLRAEQCPASGPVALTMTAGKGFDATFLITML